MRKRVCIFCGAKFGNSDELIESVKQICDALVTKGYDLVYGGGKSGLMGVVADIFLKHNHEVIGIRPKKLIIDEDAHNALNKLIIVEDMFERKKKMVEMSDVFVALPGGVGTLDEILEVFMQKKIGFNNKTCAVFNYNGFYDSLEDQLDNMVKFGFLKLEDKEKLIIENNVEELLDALQ